MIKLRYNGHANISLSKEKSSSLTEENSVRPVKTIASFQFLFETSTHAESPAKDDIANKTAKKADNFLFIFIFPLCLKIYLYI